MNNPRSPAGLFTIWLGVVFFLLGAAFEIWSRIIQAWPTGLTWIMMGAGACLTIAGAIRHLPRSADARKGFEVISKGHREGPPVQASRDPADHLDDEKKAGPPDPG